jgi:hypothetical protein
MIRQMPGTKSFGELEAEQRNSKVTRVVAE